MLGNDTRYSIAAEFHHAYLEITMPTNQVLIISPNELFRLGLQRIIRHAPDMHNAGSAASLAEAGDLICQGNIDIIVIEQNGNFEQASQEISQLLCMPGENLRVIALSLESMQMQKYQRQQIPGTSVAQFLKAIRGSHSL